jgi:hypothetical protein
MRRLWRDYSLSVVLATLFLTAWTLQTITGWFEFQADQHNHGQLAEVLGADGYLWIWARATMENWQSEFLQLLAFVVLTSFLIHKGSHESKDSDEHLRAQLARIERRLAHLHAQPASDAHSGATPSPSPLPLGEGTVPIAPRSGREAAAQVASPAGNEADARVASPAGSGPEPSAARSGEGAAERRDERERQGVRM